MKRLQPVDTITEPTPIRPNVASMDAVLDQRDQAFRDILNAYETRLAAVETAIERWPAMMTAPDAATYLSISRAMLYQLVRDGHIETVVPYGMKQQYFNRETLDAWRMRGQ